MSPRSLLITGCSSGIGRCCALGMQARGWHVFATARNDGDLAALERDGLEPVYLDYAEPASIAAAVDHVTAKTGGRLDALFNNGAYAQPGAVEDIPMQALRAQFEAAVFGWHDLTCRVIPLMRAQGFGRIVNCSSVLGIVALRYRGPYNAAKFAVEALSDTLRLELHGSPIKVSLIEPGPIVSRFRENALKAFEANIDRERSAHRAAYADELKRLRGEQAPAPFKRGPEAVLKALIHALESPKPKAHYHVTGATKLMALARRILPTRALDALARRVS